MKEQIFQAWAITDESGMLANFVEGNHVVFYRTRSAAKKENIQEIGEYNYKVVKVQINVLDY